MAYSASAAARFLGVGLTNFKLFLRETQPSYAPKNGVSYTITHENMHRCGQEFADWMAERASRRRSPQSRQDERAGLAVNIANLEKEQGYRRQREAQESQRAVTDAAHTEGAEMHREWVTEQPERERAAQTTELVRRLLAGEDVEQARAVAAAKTPKKRPVKVTPAVTTGDRVRLRAYEAPVDEPAVVLDAVLGRADLAFRVAGQWYVKPGVSFRGGDENSKYYWDVV